MVSRRIAIGFAIGFGIGISDVLLFRLLNVQMMWDGTDVTIEIVCFFAVSFGLFGAAIGRVWDQREVIREQYESLRKAKQRAIEQEKLATVGRLASGVAHEVRNPLGVIRSSASLLEEDMDAGSDNARAARFIVDEVDRLDGFVRKLLDFTKPLATEPGTVRVAELVEAATRTAGRDVTIRTDGYATFHGDFTLLVQALRNLVDNAVAAAEDQVEVNVAVGDYVVMTVRDDGPGVPEDKIDDLFEPFYTTRADGTGLGLSIANKIAEVHGGYLTYVVAAGLSPDGACFELRFPNERDP